GPGRGAGARRQHRGAVDRAHQGSRTQSARGAGGPDGARGLDHHRKEGHRAMNDQDRVPVRRALISVYDKPGLDKLAAALVAAGVEIVSTGSTASHLAASGVAVTRVEALTGFPE